MSSRLLKKLQGEPELLNASVDEHDDQLSDGDIELSVGAKKKQLNLNRYDLLNEQQSPSESEVKEDDNETEHASAAYGATVNNSLAKKKKKKRKKKSTKQAAVQRRSSEDNADIDEITRAATEVDNILGKAHKSVIPVSRGEVGKKTLLSIHSKHLNPQYEMRRTFGSRVVQAEQNKRRNTRGSRPILKTTFLANPKETWHPITKAGLYMGVSNPPEGSTSSQQQPNSKGIVWFSFEHNASYRQVQKTFLAAVDSMDSDNIVKIINRQPYHVDALIQLSELCKMTEDHAMASELIERAILAMETSFHTLFSLTAGTCRLDYRKQENRAFFIVLFKHAQYLEGRACVRTALEIAKLILSLDPENDPLAMILVVDYYALRSKEYEWLVDFYNELEPVKNLSQLPNMAYSYALALFFLRGDSEEANNAVQYALMMFPDVLKPLLQELSVQTDARVTAHNFFGVGSVKSQTPSLHQLVSLYVCRAKNIWRDANVLPWLEKNVNIVLNRVDAKEARIADYMAKRQLRYINPPRPILRHIFLSDFKEKVPLTQFINTEKEPIMMYDPLPPLDSINIYDRKRITADNNESQNQIRMFFRSMLPTFRPVTEVAARDLDANMERVRNEEGPAAANDYDGIQTIREIENSLTSIVDAMRDFLSNIRGPERPNDADIDENESSDDDTTDYLT